MEPIFALERLISARARSILIGKACNYSEKSGNNFTSSAVCESDVGWVLVVGRTVGGGKRPKALKSFLSKLKN